MLANIRFIVKTLYYNLVLFYNKKEAPIFVKFFFGFILIIIYIKLGKVPPMITGSPFNFEKLDFLIRFIMFSIPASITVYFFTYKERKESFYSSIKSNNINELFFYQISLSVLSLIFLTHISLIFTESNYNINQLMFTVAITAFSVVFLFVFIFILLRSKDSDYNNKFFIRTITRKNKILKFTIDYSENIHVNPSDFIGNYIQLIEAQYQILNSNLKLTSYLEMEKHYHKVFANSIEIFTNVINPIDFYNLLKFMKLASNNVIENSLITMYKLLLSQSKELIIQSSINKFVSLNKLMISNFIKYAPINFQNSEIKINHEDVSNGFDLEDTDYLITYQDKLIETYYGALFEIMQIALKDEKIEYSYLIQEYYTTSSSTRELGRNKSTEKITNKLVEHTIIFETSLAMWSMQQNNIKALTETTILILRNSKNIYRLFNINNMPVSIYISNMFDRMRNILKGDEIKEEASPFSKTSIIKDSYLTQLVLVAIKGHELGYYSCVGYLVKVLVKNFSVEDISGALENNHMAYLKGKKVESKPIEFGTEYFHSILHEFSFDYCFKKTALLFGVQIGYISGYKKNDLNLGNYYKNAEELIVHKEKLLAAGDKYGMLAIKQINNNNLNKLFN